MTEEALKKAQELSNKISHLTSVLEWLNDDSNKHTFFVPQYSTMLFMKMAPDKIINVAEELLNKYRKELANL